eukprot:scaffold7400_cov578-Prasinococcus_capsulatus_cf.AAC.1
MLLKLSDEEVAPSKHVDCMAAIRELLRSLRGPSLPDHQLHKGPMRPRAFSNCRAEAILWR